MVKNRYVRIVLKYIYVIRGKKRTLMRYGNVQNFSLFKND